MSEQFHFARHMAEEAWAAGNKPRIHPNGFIQLDLEKLEGDWNEQGKGHSGAKLRLHVWNPPELVVPRQETVNEVHDHIFDMRSTIIKGQLEQRLFWFVVGNPNKTHELYRAVYDKTSSSRLAPMGVYGSLQCVEQFEVLTGDQYTQPAFTFHDTAVAKEGTVMTLMEKIAIYDGEATVICPSDTPPDNTFDRSTAADPEDLWGAIVRSFENA